MDNLPGWPGADAVYGYLQEVLRSHAERAGGAWVRKVGKRRVCSPPPEVRELARLLGKGDEETLKGLALHHKTHGGFPAWLGEVPRG